MNNLSGWRPTEFNVIVLPDKVDEKKGNIFIPKASAEVEQHAATTGTLVAVSPVAFTYADWENADYIPRIGNRVMFAKYGGSLIDATKPDGYRIIKDKDILAVAVT